MNRYVVDASIAVAWFFDDEDSEVAAAAFDLLNRGAHIIAPTILWFELHNAILLGVRWQRLLESNAAALLEQINLTAIRYDPLPASSKVFALARRHRLTFYDACYLELAQREGIALATLDQPLAKAAAAEGVALIGIS